MCLFGMLKEDLKEDLKENALDPQKPPNCQEMYAHYGNMRLQT